MFYYVYKMIHVPTGRVYVGRHRLQKGQTPETDGYHGSGKLWKQIYKQNPEECVKVVLEVVEDKETADVLEKKFIAHYRSLMGEFCMNVNDGGGGVDKHTELSKQKIAESKRGKHHSDATKQKMSEALRGEKNPNFGKHHSEEHRKKLSDANVGKTPWNKGKRLSEDHRKKLSDAHKGKCFSEATRKKMSEAQRRRRLSKEQKDRTVL